MALISNKFHQSASQSEYSSKFNNALFSIIYVLASMSATNCGTMLPLVSIGSVTFPPPPHTQHWFVSQVWSTENWDTFFYVIFKPVIYFFKIRQNRTSTGRHEARSFLSSKLSDQFSPSIFFSILIRTWVTCISVHYYTWCKLTAFMIQLSPIFSQRQKLRE